MVFHTAVSGIPLEAPRYRYVDAGPDWATGGEWGPEGGIPAGLGMAGGIVYLFVLRGRGSRRRGDIEHMAERVAVIGAGQMGNGIAHVFAQTGFDVTMIDVSAEALERGKGTIAANLDRQIKKGTLQAAEKDAILGRVSTDQSLASAADASLVVEAATENRDLKFKIFAELDRVARA